MDHSDKANLVQRIGGLNGLIQCHQ